MTRFRSFAAFLAAFVLLFSAALAEESVLDGLEVEEISFVDLTASGVSDDPAEAAEAGDVFTPSYGSPYDHDLGSSYWTTPMDITDTETVWKMLMEPITVVDIGPKGKLNHSQLTKQNLYMYKEPDTSSKIIGEITNLSQGLRVIEKLDNGWSLVECYSSSFISKPATKIQAWNILVSGYVESKYLKQVTPTDKLALVVDKLTQRVYVFTEGEMIAELLCSTGLVQWNGKKYQPYNETRSGEFLLINMTGSLDSDKLKCSYAIRFNAGDEIHEVPHQVRADGTFDYRTTEPKLGTKRSHGCIRVQRYPTPDGINMAWIYKRVRDLDLCGKVKIIIWEDWQGRQIPTPSPDLQLYYNPNKGQYYHSQDHCKNGKGITFTPFSYSQLEEDGFAKLTACPYCVPAMRESEIKAINETYAPGGDHEELLNSLRKNYYEYLAQE